jgi:hypothetical protein
MAQILPPMWRGGAFLLRSMEIFSIPEASTGLWRHAGYGLLKRLRAQNAGVETVPAVYARLGIRQVALPVGYSAYQPVELFFNWLDGDLRRKKRPEERLIEWTIDDFRREIAESCSRVTISMVKGWYREAWRHMFPGKAIPIEISG